MRALIATAFFLVIAAEAKADYKINITTPQQKFSMYSDMIEGIARAHGEVLNDSLGRKLECRLVKLKTNILKDSGVFSKGLYTMTLTGICNKEFSDMKLKVVYGEDYGNAYQVKLSYKEDGKQKTITSTDNSTDD